MFLFYVLRFFKKGTLFKGRHYLRKYRRRILISRFYVDSKKVSKKFLHLHYSVLENPPLPHPKEDFFFSFERVEGDFLVQGSDGGGTWNFDIRNHRS